MSKPIPGKNYTIQDEETLSNLASIAYGDASLWGLIYKANLKTLKSNDPDIIFPDEVLFIPERPELRDALEKIIQSSSSTDGFVLEIGGREIPIISGKAIRTMDTAADAWTAVIAWTPGADLFIDRVTAPYSYEKSKVFLDGVELVTGPLFLVKQMLNEGDGQRKELGGFSATVSIVDSDMNPELYQEKNVSLKDRCTNLLEPYGLKVVVDSVAAEAANEIFKRVKSKKDETIFKHLSKLAKQRQVLISSTVKGNLLLTKSKTKNQPVGIIEEASVNPALSYQAIFDGRKRFSSYRVTSQTPKKRNKKVGISNDPNVPIMRFKNITVDNATDGNIKNIADWARSKQFASALTIPFPVPSWHDPNGNLWRENTTVVVKSKTIGTPDGFTFLIRQVEYNFSESGRTAILNLIPPQTYTGEPIIEPWRV